MKKKIIIICLFVCLFLVSAAGVSARNLMINPEEFYDKFCRIARETYGGKFCTSALVSTSSGYGFTTAGGFTVHLISSSAKKDMESAILQMPASSSLRSKEARTAMYAHFLTADNNIFASEATFSKLENYVENISTKLGRTFEYDRIRILSEKTSSGYLMKAYN